MAIKDTNMYEEADRANCEIFAHSLVFDQQDRDLKLIDTLTVEEFRAFFETFFFSN